MPKLPVVSGKEMVRFLEKQGFEIVRQRGSHLFLRNFEANLRTTVAVHAKENLRPGTLLGILSDIEMSKVEFCKKFKSK